MTIAKTDVIGVWGNWIVYKQDKPNTKIGMARIAEPNNKLAQTPTHYDFVYQNDAESIAKILHNLERIATCRLEELRDASIKLRATFPPASRFPPRVGV